MAIKKLQQNFTTPEQSNRLLELGLPADSADCYINEVCNNRAFQLPDIFSKCTWLSDKKPIPCWSVGRLIELYRSIPDARQMTFVNLAYTDDITELLVEKICSLIHSNKKKEEVRKKCEAEKIQARKKIPNKTSRDIEVLSLSSKMFGEMIVDDFNDDFIRMTDFM